LKDREKEYCTYEDINVYLVTWNVAGVEPNHKNMDFKKKLFNFQNKEE